MDTRYPATRGGSTQSVIGGDRDDGLSKHGCFGSSECSPQ